MLRMYLKIISFKISYEKNGPLIPFSYEKHARTISFLNEALTWSGDHFGQFQYERHDRTRLKLSKKTFIIS